MEDGFRICGEHAIRLDVVEERAEMRARCPFTQRIHASAIERREHALGAERADLGLDILRSTLDRRRRRDDHAMSTRNELTHQRASKRHHGVADSVDDDEAARNRVHRRTVRKMVERSLAVDGAQAFSATGVGAAPPRTVRLRLELNTRRPESRRSPTISRYRFA